MSNYLFLLLILACPLMMVFMMRGMHSGRGEGERAGRGQQDDRAMSLDPHRAPDASLAELQRRRDQLDREIAERTAEEETPVGGGWR